MKTVETVRFGKRGEGSLIKRPGSAFWYGRMCVDGIDAVWSLKTSDLETAKKRFAAKVKEKGAADLGLTTFQTPRMQRVTINALLDALEKDYEKRKRRAMKSFRSHLVPLRGYFGHRRAVTVDTDAVNDFIKDQRKAGKADATINRSTQVLAQAFRFGLEHKKILTVPKITRLPEDNARSGFFERADFERVVTHLPAYLRDVARFGYLTGWRRNEILTLSWSDVDMAGGVIRLRPEHAKTGTGRTVVLDTTLGALMARREEARLSERGVADLVFHRSGKPIGDFRYAWGNACVAAGLAVTDPKTGKITADRLFHDLRRTAVRNMVRSGVPERVAMAISGHKTRSMFDRYNIVDESDLRAAQVAIGKRYEAITT